MEESLSHSYPLGHLANDNFAFMSFTHSLQIAGTYNNYEPYLSAGYDNTIAFHPPVVHYLSVYLSNTLGIEIYDSIVITCFIFSLLAMLLFYFLIRKVNRNLALLSLPLMAMLYPNFPNRLILKVAWGQFPYIIGSVVFIFFFWSLFHIKEKGFWVLFAASIVGTIYTHTSEFIFEIMFMAVWGGWLLLRKKLDLDIIKKIASAGILSFIFSAYFLFLFKKAFLDFRPYVFKIDKCNPFTTVCGPSFGMALWMWVFIAIGIVISVMLIKKEKFYPFMVSGFTFLIAFTNIIGFRKRAFETRNFFPIYLSIFFAYGLYTLINQLFKKKEVHRFLVAAILSLILFVPVFVVNQTQASGSLIPEPMYDAFEWIKNNAEQDAVVYYGYNSNIQQTGIIFESQRVGYRQTMEDLVMKIKLSEMPPTQSELWMNFEGSSRLAYWDGLSVKNHIEDIPSIRNINRSMCSFEYLFYPLFNLEEEVAKFQAQTAQSLLDTQKFENAFYNQYVIILKNNDVGDECEFNRTN